jgi:hypothetical protein
VLHRFAKKLGLARRTRWRTWSALPWRRYLKLFQPLPSPRDVLFALDRRRYKRMYRVVREIASVHPPKCDPLSAKPAVSLQGALLSRVFRVIFSVRLSRQEASIYGRYGGASLAIRDFLAYCGCPKQLLVLESFAEEAHRFAMIAEHRHQEVAAGNNYEIARKHRHLPWSSRIFPRLQELVRAQNWRRTDAFARVAWRTQRAAAYAECLSESISRWRELADRSQAGMRDVFLDQIHLSSLEAVAIVLDRALHKYGSVRVNLYRGVLSQLQENREQASKTLSNRRSSNV